MGASANGLRRAELSLSSGTLPSSALPGLETQWWLQEALLTEALSDGAAPLEREPLEGTLDVDVAIVGGGYTGLWTALALCERAPGTRVALVEAGICGSGASGKNGGLVHGYWAYLPRLSALLGAAGAREVADAGSRAQAAIAGFAARAGLNLWWRPDGLIKVATVPAHAAKLRELVETAQRLGVGDKVVALSADEVRARCRSPRFSAGVLLPEAATVQPGRLVRALRGAALAAGVEIFERSRVLTVRPGERNVVVTNAGEIRASEVVLATNAALTGMRPMRRHLTNFGSYVVLTEPVPELLRQVGWTGGEGITDGRMFLHYFRTTPDGRLLMGSGSGPVGFAGRIDSRFTQDAASAWRAESGIRGLLPDLQGAKVTHAWGGAIDVSADHLPFFGTVPHTRVHYACGYSGHGVNPTYIGGQTLASLALGVQDEWTALPFCTRRVASLPMEPVRYVGARLVQASIRACEEADDAGVTAPLIARAGAKLPELLGMKVGLR